MRRLQGVALSVEQVVVIGGEIAVIVVEAHRGRK